MHVLHRLRLALPSGTLALFGLSSALALAAVLLFAWAHGRGGASVPNDEPVALESATDVDATRSQPQAASARSEMAAAGAMPSASKAATKGAGASPLHGATRALERDGSLDLLVPDVGRAIGRLRASVAALGGDFTDFEDTRPDSPSDPRTLTAKIVVPQNEFDHAMDVLAGLGGVRSRTATAQDVGNTLVDDDARLRNMRRTERDLLRIMDRSGKVGEILDVENQLATVRDDIERLDAERAELRGRVDDATIALTLTAETSQQTSPAEPSALSQIGAAWDDARRASGAFALALIATSLFVIAFAPYWFGGTLALMAAIVVARRLLRRFSRPRRPLAQV